MELYTDRISNLVNEKILLFQNLVDILNEERKSIRAIDMDGLWASSEKKKKSTLQIEDVRRKMLDVLSEASIEHDMSVPSFKLSKVISLISANKDKRINGANARLILLKKEVNRIATENKKYIKEYLGVLDEMIGTITNASDPPPVYGKNKYSTQKRGSSFMLNTEV